MVPVDVIVAADERHGVRFADVAHLFRPLRTFPADLAVAASGVSVVLDDFAFDLHLGDRYVASGTHDGSEFRTLAIEHGVDVYIATEIEVRRSSVTDLAAAAAAGRVVGATVAAFGVHTLDGR